MSKQQYTYLDSKQISHTVEIGEDDLRLVQEHEIITDQKLQTKPTTFLKDALKRFAKNKSSVVGAGILGVIVLLAIVLPIAIQSDISSTSSSNAYQTKLAPKLFDAGFGFWDGCESRTDAIIDVDWDEYDETGTITGLPADVAEKDIVGGMDGISYSDVKYVETYSAYGHGGYTRLHGAGTDAAMTSPNFQVDLSGTNEYSITIETTSYTGIEGASWNYGEETPYSLSFVWYSTSSSSTAHEVTLIDSSTTYGTTTVSLNDFVEQIQEEGGQDMSLLITTDQRPHLVVTVEAPADTSVEGNLLIDSIVVSSSDETEQETLSQVSFTDATEMAGRASSGYYWAATVGYRNLYRSMNVTGSYRFDTYENALGTYVTTDAGTTAMQAWVDRGWLSADVSSITRTNLRDKTSEEVAAIAVAFEESFKVLSDRCPLQIDENFDVYVSSGYVFVSGTVTRWKALFLDRDSMPRYLMGTDASGRDLLKYTFAGIRTSLLLGVITAAVCFVFGLFWGSITGYFGGWVDILMERFTDILGGVPWIVVMTLAIILLGSNFGTFAMALCLTGWIGISSTTRTQFYRYKDREYVLAARTLGASDFRLIFRHILPNAVGTIITSCALLIPSAIFSEATISYLNLGLQGMASFGVILSDNQQYLQTYPYMIVFPSVLMALIMISFNLFGNGLRDAFNPSLKGAEQ